MLVTKYLLSPITNSVDAPAAKSFSTSLTSGNSPFTEAPVGSSTLYASKNASKTSPSALSALSSSSNLAIISASLALPLSFSVPSAL